jgi:CRP/FNR family transcriptional regulator
MSHTDLAPSIRPARAIAAELPISRAPVLVPVPAVHCAACPCPEHCLPRGPSGGAGERRTHLSGARKVLAGQVLYGQGERFQFIYSVRCGTLKSTLTLSDGRAQVCGFHMAGEVIALDAVAAGTHGTTASALEDAHVCAIEKICRLLRSPSQADALGTGRAVEDEDADPVGPAPQGAPIAVRARLPRATSVS